MWDKAQNFGVIKINGKDVKLYYSNSSYSTIHVGYEVDDARWAGNHLVVNLRNGKARRYSSLSSYTNV